MERVQRVYQYDPANPGGTTDAGVFFHEGGAKPAFTAWRFPFVVDSKGLAWGRSPQRGKVRIQRKRGSGWRTVERKQARPGAVFTKKLGKVRTGARFRAVVNGESSLTWKVQR